MDPLRESLIRLGMEVGQLGMKPGMDPHDLVRYALGRLCTLANSAGLECKVKLARDHSPIAQLDDDIRAAARDLARLN